MSAEQTPDIADVLADLIADDPMWIGDDGQPLDYLPERESRIADFVAAADAALAPVLAAAVREATELPADGHAPSDASAVVAGSEREVAAVPSAGFTAATRTIAEAVADRVTWDDGTEYINVEDAARLLDVAVSEADRQSWSEGYEFALRNLRDEAVQADLQRITEPVSHEAATSGEEASKA